MRIIIIASFAGLFVCCAPNSFYINQEYLKGTLAIDTVFVFPISSDKIDTGFLATVKSFLGNEKSLFIRDFKLKNDANTEAVYADTFNAYFPKYLNTSLKWYTSKITMVSKTFEIKEVKYFNYDTILNQKSSDSLRLNFKVPDSNEISSRNITTRYVLIPNNLKISWGFTSGTPGFGGVAGTPSTKSLILSIYYIVWDYKNNKPVAFGVADGLVSAKYYTTNSDWYDIIKEACKMLISNSPYNINIRK